MAKGIECSSLLIETLKQHWNFSATILPICFQIVLFSDYVGADDIKNKKAPPIGRRFFNLLNIGAMVFIWSLRV